MSLPKRVMSSAVICLGIAWGPVTADVMIEQKMDMEGRGNFANFSSSGIVKTYVSGMKSRTEENLKSNSRLMGFMAGDENGISISRLDKSVLWNLDPDKRQYREMTFEEMRSAMQQANQQMAKLQSSGALPVREEDCQWSDAHVNVDKTGEKKRFANVKAQKYLITATETCTVPSSGQVCKITWEMETWMAKRMPGARELNGYARALAGELGLDTVNSPAHGASVGMTSLFGDGWDDVQDEAAKLKGYPVKTVMEMKMGGKGCTSAGGQPIAMDSVWGNAVDAGVQAGARTAGYHAGSKVTQETVEAMGGGVAGSVAGSAIGAASGEVISGMLSHFGRKSKKPKPQAQEQATTDPASGSAVLYRVSTELTAVDDGRIPADRFEVPAGWEKAR